jgi:hypothetical protein
MSESVYVMFDDSSHDPTFSGVEDSYLVLMQVPSGVEVQYLGPAMIDYPTKSYSVAEMLRVLEERGLLHECEVASDLQGAKVAPTLIRPPPIE